MNSVFGKIKTDNTSNMIYEWEIKILYTSNGLMGIGICNERCNVSTEDAGSVADIDYDKFCVF